MTLQYDLKLSIEAADKWGDSRKTHKAVAMAIHAIADKNRSAQQIWEEPTQAEYDHVRMAVENYIDNGVFLPEENGRYPWGEGVITIQISRYEIIGIVGAGYKVRMMWSWREQKWIDPSRHDGTGTSFSDRATAQLELEKAKRDQDVEDVEIVETVVDDD